MRSLRAVALASLLVGCAHGATNAPALDPIPPEVDACRARPALAGYVTCIVAAVMTRRAPELAVREVRDLALEARLPDGTSVELDLDDAFGRCEANRDDCPMVLATFVSGFFDYLDGHDVPVEPSQVRAILRSRAYVEALAGAPLVRPFVGDLMVVFVQDLPRAARPLVETDRLALGLDQAGLEALALRNVREALGSAVPDRAAEGPLHVTDVGGHEEASRLLLHDAWADVAARLPGDLVVVAPVSSLVIFTGTGTEGALALLRRRADEITGAGSERVSTTLLRYTPAGWEPLP